MSDLNFENYEENELSNEEIESNDNNSESEEEISKEPKRKLENEAVSGNKKFKAENPNKNLYKQPTAKEISRLRETEQLFHSNLFRLQIEQLLDEVKIKEKYKKPFYKWYEEVTNVLDNLQEYAFDLSDLDWNKKNKFLNRLHKAYNSNLKTDQDLCIKLKKPETYNIIGLHKFIPSANSKFKVNISVHIPDDSLLAGDYLNNRFKIKQSYYTTYIYLNLKKPNLCSEINCKTSTLEIIPNFSEKIVISVHILPPKNYFKVSRFIPTRNNIRDNLFHTVYQFDTISLSSVGTPLYNSLLLHELTLVQNYDLVEQTLKEYKNIHDGMKLLIVWLQQRGLYDNEYGFSDILLGQIVLYLTIKRKINKHMSSYQVVRIFWVFLSTTNWHTNPISICDNVDESLLKDFQENFDVVFLDQTGVHNLAAFLQYDVYLKIRSEAGLAVTFLDNITFDSFGGLFMNKMSPELQYDALLVLQDEGYFKNVYEMISENEKYRNVGFYRHIIIKQILKILHKGLTKRVAQIVPFQSDHMDNGSFTKITFGITLDPSNAFSLIEKGPEANTPAAHEFKNFWGKLSEMRRFVDGAICEAVYFPAKTVQEKRCIFQNIINFVVTKKLKIEKHYIIADQFENIISLKNEDFVSLGTCEESTVNVIMAFDAISKELRDSKLPLSITAVKGASQLFCYSSPFPPTPNVNKLKKGITTHLNNNTVFKESPKCDSIPNYVEAIDCVFQLGMNSKWPQNLEALRYLQLGFYIELSKYLESKKILSNVRRDKLDVLYKGFVFRFRMYNPREITELRKYTQSDGTVAFKDTAESVDLEYNLSFVPQIIGALHGIQSQNASYGPTTALIKRWLRSQMVDEYHISDMVINLLNAYLFINSAPYNTTNLPQVGFLRFLKFIAHCDWKLQLILVNFNNELTKESVDQYETNFQQTREDFPALAVITPYDNIQSLCSKNCTVEILNRFSVLAKCTYKYVEKGIFEQNLSINELFVPNLQGYSVLIHLKEYLNSKKYQSCSVQDNKQDSKIPIINFFPVEHYLKELRIFYGNFALFFYDSFGGNVIGVLWKPEIFESKPFKISHIDGRKMKENNVVVNIDAIMEDFAILGDGLVKSVEKVH